MKKIKVVIVDDHAVVRDGIKSLLDESSEIEITGEASNADEAIEKVRTLSPDILLADISMPDKSGIEIAGTIGRNFPGTKVVMFSMHEDEEYITKAIENKAAGYVSKNSEKEEIINALKTVAAGGQYFSDSISRKMLASYVATRQTRVPMHHNTHLTSREKEILTLVATGCSSKEIADKLIISTRTVETHRNNIMQKLEVKNSAELIKYVISNKLIELG